MEFGGKHQKRSSETIDVEDFIGKKGFKAKGKKATTYEVASIKFIEPLEKDMPDNVDDGNSLPDSGDNLNTQPSNDMDDAPTLF